jgi:NarL family two-component system response regulator LiaR
MGKIRIIIADDHIIVREGTCELLEQEEDMEVIAQAGDGEEAVRLVAELKPDIAILDIAMPVMDGIDATRRIRSDNPDTRVLILSAYDDDQFIVRLIEAGAAGYLLKNIHRRELISTIRAIFEGESVLHPSILRKVLTNFTPLPGRPTGQDPSEKLSERELEVLKLIAYGVSNKQIADELHISTRTVQGRLSQIFTKMGVNSRTEALVRALNEGYVTLSDVRQETAAATFLEQPNGSL